VDVEHALLLGQGQGARIAADQRTELRLGRHGVTERGHRILQAGQPAARSVIRRHALCTQEQQDETYTTEETTMIYILLWLLGIPLGVILLLFLFGIGR
jgi:hypothetical protein